MRPLAEQFLLVLSLIGSRDWQVYPATTRTTVLSSMQTVFGASGPWRWTTCSVFLCKSCTAEKYFRKRLRRQQRNMPALPAIVISDDSDNDVEILNWRSWCSPSLSRCPLILAFCLFSHTLLPAHQPFAALRWLLEMFLAVAEFVGFRAGGRLPFNDCIEYATAPCWPPLPL